MVKLIELSPMSISTFIKDLTDQMIQIIDIGTAD